MTNEAKRCLSSIRDEYGINFGLVEIGGKNIVDLTLEWCNKNLKEQSNHEEEQENKKMYILCNRRLQSTYQIVQGSHALAQWILEHPGQYDNKNTTLVYLNCSLNKKMEHMDEHGYDYTVWKEPDLNDAITAVACLGDKDLLFTRLKTVN